MITSFFTEFSISIFSNPFYSKLVGWFAMFLAMMSGASIGPMFKYLENQNIAPLMAASWRCQCMLLFLIPLAFIETRWISTQWLETKPGLKYPVIVYILIAGVSWAGNLLSWISGLKYVSVVKASIIASLHPLLLVFVLYFTGESISAMEWFGTFVSVVGMVISSGKGLYHLYHTENTDEDAVNARLELYGLALCFVAAASEVVVILNRSQIKQHVPLMQYTASTTVVVAFLASLSAVLTQSDPTSHLFCIREDCLYGWASPEWFEKILIFAFIVGVICMMGFNYAIVHISPLVFSSIQLLDPVLSGILVWISGIEGIPDVLTWIGGLVIMAGVGMITIGEYKRTHMEEKAVTEDFAVTLAVSKKMLEMKGGGRDDSSLSSSDDADTVLISAESFDEESSLHDGEEDSLCLHSPQTTGNTATAAGGLTSQSNDLSLSSSIVSSSQSFIHHLPSLQLSLWKGQEYSALSAVEDEERIEDVL